MFNALEVSVVNVVPCRLREKKSFLQAPELQVLHTVDRRSGTGDAFLRPAA